MSRYPGKDKTLRALEVTVIVYKEVVPWRYPAVRELQFGEWPRKDNRPFVKNSQSVMLLNGWVLIYIKYISQTQVLITPRSNSIYKILNIITECQLYPQICNVVLRNISLLWMFIFTAIR